MFQFKLYNLKNWRVFGCYIFFLADLIPEPLCFYMNHVRVHENIDNQSQTLFVSKISFSDMQQNVITF